MKDAGGSELWYLVDGEDRLIEASARYFELAARNGLPEPRSAIGKPLWDFVSGSSVRAVQKALLGRVRRSGNPVVVQSRCDGPGVRRDEFLEIRPGEGPGHIAILVRTVTEEYRPPRALLDPEQRTGRRSLTMCSWCDRVRAGSGWVEVEQAAGLMGLTSSDFAPQIDYDLCDRCRQLLSDA
jgi:hypothetical protein